MMFSCIYQIKNNINQKIYVGSAVSWKRRIFEHKTRLRAGTHHNQKLQRSWNKYGEQNFTFKIIEYVEDKLKLIEREQYWMNKLNVFDENIGYNLCKEGRNNLGIKRSEETKHRISLGNKNKVCPPERKLKISNSLKGIKFHPSRKTNKGQKWSEKRRQSQRSRIKLSQLPIIIAI